MTLLDRKELSIRVGDRYRAVGAGTQLRALGAAGLISQEQIRELEELREVRNRLVHFGDEKPPEIDNEMISRLKRAQTNLVKQIEDR